MSKLTLAALVLVFCPTVSSCGESRVPTSLVRGTIVVGVDHGFGSGSPIGPNRIVTALHVVDGAKTILWRASDGTTGAATVICKDEPADLAILMVTSGGPLPEWFILGHTPSVGDRLWWGTILYDEAHTRAYVTGNYLGSDDEGFLAADGIAFRGASGGPIVNEKGELVAVLQATVRPQEKQSTGFWRSYMSGRDPRGSCGIK